MSDEDKKQEETFNERRVRRSTLRKLERMGFSWIEEEVRVKPEDRDRAYVLSAVVYRAGEDGEKHPFIVVDIKENPGTWARDQMIPYAEFLDAPYIYITNDRTDYWYRTENPDEPLDTPPDSPGPESGARDIQGPDEIADIQHFFNRTLDLDNEKRDGQLLASLLIKFAYERTILETEPVGESSLRSVLTGSDVPEFLRNYRLDLAKQWERIWRYLNSYSFPASYRWSAFMGWLSEEIGRFRIDEDQRALPDNTTISFFRDLASSTHPESIGVIEHNLGAVGMSLAEQEVGSVTVFDPDEPFVDVIRAITWAGKLKEPSGFDVAGTDPVRANIVSQFEEQFDLFIYAPFEKGLRRRKNESLPDTYELSGHRTPEAVYLEAILRMLKPDGRLIALVPEVLLSGKRNRNVRNYVRSRANVEASIEFPVTNYNVRRRSVCCLICRKHSGDDPAQEDVFMGLVEDRDEPEPEIREIKEELCTFLSEKL